MVYSWIRRILRSLMTPICVDRMVLAMERRALRLLISASWVGVWMVVEDISMRVVDVVREEEYVTGTDRWSSLWCVTVDWT